MLAQGCLLMLLFNFDKDREAWFGAWLVAWLAIMAAHYLLRRWLDPQEDEERPR